MKLSGVYKSVRHKVTLAAIRPTKIQKEMLETTEQQCFIIMTFIHTFEIKPY